MVYSSSKSQTEINLQKSTDLLQQCLHYVALHHSQIAEGRVDMDSVVLSFQGLKLALDSIFQQLNNPYNGLFPVLEKIVSQNLSYHTEAIKRDRTTQENMSKLLEIVTQLAATVTAQNTATNLKVSRMDFVAKPEISLNNDDSDYKYDGLPGVETTENSQSITRKKDI